MDKQEGLKVKYVVFKTEDLSMIEGCFVLRPDKDQFARVALKAYADATDNKALSQDIHAWMDRLESEEE